MLKGERCNSPKCAMVKKNYPPGVHGPKGRGRQSGYSLELREKQKAKRIYNLLEKQFTITFEKARHHKGDTGENFLKLLETRLDNAVYRLGFADTRFQARSMINHGHITINGKKVDIPSHRVKTGDIIAIKESSKKDKPFANLPEKLKKATLPSWLNLDINNLSAKVLHDPIREDAEQKINTQLIVEFYSR